MAGTLYVIGVGPGDPELLTLKGARLISQVGSICVPKGKEAGESLALSIVRKAVDLGGKEIVEAFFPMRRTDRAANERVLGARWHEAATILLERLRRGIDVAFITLGDPAVYSTFFYLYDRLVEAEPGLRIEIVPGVSSINASAARARIPLGLGDGRIAILPAGSVDDLAGLTGRFDTVVLMKVHKAFHEIRAALGELGLLEKAVYVSRAGMADEAVCTDLAGLKPEGLDYFSMVIVKK
ncbi:MAG: precorrin-2 C(20)-methyltransferase [Syntrophorhabdales bacterium]|jgi:precorrin-2/cobalt-factor-2 C20-methyltransferase